MKKSILFLVIFISLSFSYAYAFSFVVFGDNRDGDQVFMDVLEKVNQEKGVVFAFNTGDLVSSGSAKQYQKYKEMISRLKIPLYNVLGNHDAVYGGQRIFEKLFGATYYSFDYQNSHFVILNNALSDSFDRRQFEWLKNDLAKSSQAEHKFVFMHKPAFDPSELYKGHIMSGRKVIEELMEVFRKHKVDYVFAGHIHGYAKRERDGVTYVVTGGAGAPLHLSRAAGGYNHFVRVDVENSKIIESVKRIYE